MTKSDKKRVLKNRIEENKIEISKMLSGVGTHKRLNNLNWLRHQISYEEPRTLIPIQRREQSAFLDHTNMTNIGTAYDYIVENTSGNIDINEICKLHSILCAGTNIVGGLFRSTEKVIEINVNGSRMHAPDSHEIVTRLSEIIYKLNSDNSDTLTRAFNIHYELIALQPFDDFNKRTARMVMNWVLIQGGYRPIAFNKPSDKVKYRAAITAMANGQVKEYTKYMSQALLRTQDDILKTLKRSKII